MLIGRHKLAEWKNGNTFRQVIDCLAGKYVAGNRPSAGMAVRKSGIKGVGFIVNGRVGQPFAGGNGEKIENSGSPGVCLLPEFFMKSETGSL